MLRKNVVLKPWRVTLCSPEGITETYTVPAESRAAALLDHPEGTEGWEAVSVEEVCA